MNTHLFVAAPRGAGTDPERWGSALRGEWELRAGGPGREAALRSIFVEAGSATFLGASLARRVRELLGPSQVEAVREWTVELDTPSTPLDWIASWLEAGVTRLSLRERAATQAEVRRLCRALAGASLEPDVGVEVEVAPGAAAARQVRGEIQAALDAGATSVALAESDAGSEWGPGSSPETDAWWSAMGVFDEAGWDVPELSMAHSPGHPPLYALALARRAPVVGLGPGAISFRHPVREWNHPAWGPYAASVQRGTSAAEGGGSRLRGAAREVLTPAEGRLERIWMALRTDGGLRLPASMVRGSMWESGPLRQWLSLGWMHPLALGQGRAEGTDPPFRLRLTREGWRQADHLAVEIASMLDG